MLGLKEHVNNLRQEIAQIHNETSDERLKPEGGNRYAREAVRRVREERLREIMIELGALIESSKS